MRIGTDDAVWIVDGRCKGFPPEASLPAEAIAAQRWSVHSDFMTPIAVIDERALEHNLSMLREYCVQHGVSHAPHGKTTMSPELIRSQLDSGVWGMTAASPSQARVMLEAGAPRVLIANECADPVALDLTAGLHEDFADCELFMFVDSRETVAALAAALRRCDRDGESAPRPFPVIIDVGVPAGRAGVRTVEQADVVAEMIAAEPLIELVGVGGFEGIIGSDRSAETTARVRTYLGVVRAVAERLMDTGRFNPARSVILTAGGSAFFDHVVDVFLAEPGRYTSPIEVVIRPGAYIVHDGGVHRRVSPLEGTDRELTPALFVWSTVLSVPEPGLAILDAGKRDLSTEGEVHVEGIRRAGSIRPIAAPGPRVSGFNDQHGYLRFEPTTVDLHVGDRILLAPSHACVTFDKWRVIPVVAPDGTVTSAIRTRF